MSWLLNTSKQQAGQPSGDEATGLLILQPATVNKPGSTAGSAALSEKTLNEEMWNQKISSSSEMSSVVRKKANK